MQELLVNVYWMYRLAAYVREGEEAIIAYHLHHFCASNHKKQAWGCLDDIVSTRMEGVVKASTGPGDQVALAKYAEK